MHNADVQVAGNRTVCVLKLAQQVGGMLQDRRLTVTAEVTVKHLLGPRVRPGPTHWSHLLCRALQPPGSKVMCMLIGLTGHAVNASPSRPCMQAGVPAAVLFQMAKDNFDTAKRTALFMCNMPAPADKVRESPQPSMAPEISGALKPLVELKNASCLGLASMILTWTGAYFFAGHVDRLVPSHKALSFLLQ